MDLFYYLFSRSAKVVAKSVAKHYSQQNTKTEIGEVLNRETKTKHHTFIHPPPSYNTISPFCPSFPPHLYKYFNLSPISFIKHTLTLFFFFLSFITLIRRLRSSRFSNRTARGPLSASLTFPTFSLYVSIFLPLSLPLQNKSLYYNPLFRSLCISITSLSLRIISYLSSLARTHTHTLTRVLRYAFF